MKTSNKVSSINVIILVLLSFTNVSLFQIGNANFTLFHLYFSYFFVNLLRYNGINFRIPKYFYLFIINTIFVNLINLDAIKVTSFIYTLITSVIILVLFNGLKKINKSTINKAIKVIFLVNLISVLIAHLFVYIGYEPNDFLKSFVGIYFSNEGEFRPHAFSEEPSYASIIIVLLLVLFYRLNNSKIIKKNILWYLIGITIIFLFGSAYGLLFLFLFLISVLLNNIQLKKIILLSIFSPLLLIILNYTTVNIKPIDRITSIFGIYSENNLRNSMYEIGQLDGSAAMRFLPTFNFLDNISTFTYKNIFFGHGSGAAEKYFSSNLGYEKINLGLSPAFIYDYGFVGFILLLFTINSLMPKRKILINILFCLFLFNANYNTQMFLFFIVIIILLKRVDEITPLNYTSYRQSK